MATPDFNLRNLYNALDERRRLRELSWTAVTREINRFKTEGHPIATSTITGLKNKSAGEGDGILQMLLWLGRRPESFVPGIENADAEWFQLRDPGPVRVLRWDAKALYSAMNAQRHARAKTWKVVAQEVGGFTPAMLTNLSNGGRVGFPGVMRIVWWLGEPAAAFRVASDR